MRQIFKNSVQIPKNLVSLEENGSYVYIIRHGKIIKEKINLQASENENFIAENTFQNGDYLLAVNFKESYLNKTISPVLPQPTKKEKQ